MVSQNIWIIIHFVLIMLLMKNLRQKMFIDIQQCHWLSSCVVGREVGQQSLPMVKQVRYNIIRVHNVFVVFYFYKSDLNIFHVLIIIIFRFGKDLYNGAMIKHINIFFMLQ